MSHADTLDQQERLVIPFWGSIAMHIAIAGLLIGYGIASNRHHMRWGSKDGGGGLGTSVVVNPTATIPLQTFGPVNPVANPSKSQVPTPPPKKAVPKTQPKAKAPDPDAISLKSKTTPKKVQERVPEPVPTPNKFRDTQVDTPNQLYGRAGPALSSPMLQKPGSGNLGVGSSSPFGEDLGYYANILQDRIAQHWRTDDVPPQVRSTQQPVIVTFTLRRDGSIGGIPQIKQSSGVPALDRSAQRAIVEATPFPQIPAKFLRNEAQVELTFELRR
jgi:TonB family protein